MLLAAAVAAIALVPAVVAYLQLGYHADVRARGEFAAPEADAERVLYRSLHRASANVSAEYSWDRHESAVAEVQRRIAPRLAALRESRVTRGTAFQVSYNGSAAGAWAAENCPGGPGREFGDCEVVDGVVVQERAGVTHVVAAGFDVRVTTAQRSVGFTVVVRAD